MRHEIGAACQVTLADQLLCLSSAALRLADHISRFWARSMQQKSIEYATSGGGTAASNKESNRSIGNRSRGRFEVTEDRRESIELSPPANH